MKLTRKAIAAAALAKKDGWEKPIQSIELVRDPHGYFYCVGNEASGMPFVSNGIYRYRLGGCTLEDWVIEVQGAINHVIA